MTTYLFFWGRRMFKYFLMLISVLLSVMIAPAKAGHVMDHLHYFHGKDDSGNSHGFKGSHSRHRSKERSLHDSKGSCNSKGSHGSHEHNSFECDRDTKKADKAYRKYLEYHQKYVSCQENAQRHGAKCKKQKHGSKGSRNHHGSSDKKCRRYKKKAERAYQKYLFYDDKRKKECQNSLPPVALDQNISLSEDTNISIILTGTDSGGHVLVYSLLTQPTHGTLSGIAPNLLYQPNPNYAGSDSFTFKVNNGSMDSATATVSITVTPVNDAPIARDDNTSTDEDTQTTIDVLSNDHDRDGTLDAATLTLVRAPAHGTATVSGDKVLYTPAADYHGTDSFTYTVQDNDGLVSNEATVSIVVNSINDAPVAVDDNVTTQEGTPIRIEPLINDIDPDGNDTLLRIVSIEQPRYGKARMDKHAVYYTPQSDSAMLDRIVYMIEDGDGARARATISIHIALINDAPTAYNQTIETDEDHPVSFELNASDPDGDPIVYTLLNPALLPKHGTVTGTPPHLTYTPNPNYNGDDYIVFGVNDGKVDSAPAVITIVVHPLNDPPVADAGADVRGLRGDTFMLDGSASYDIDGNITHYLWQEGNTTIGTEKILHRQFTITGQHRIRLTVTDDQNASDSDEKIITIESCSDGCVYPDPTATNPYQ
jgi:hypothetical protein